LGQANRRGRFSLPARAPRHKTTAADALRNAAIAIFTPLSTASPSPTIFPFAPWPCGHFFGRRERTISMQRVTLLLRTTPRQIGRRIAQFVAIAAASLPDVGA